MRSMTLQAGYPSCRANAIENIPPGDWSVTSYW